MKYNTQKTVVGQFEDETQSMPINRFIALNAKSDISNTLANVELIKNNSTYQDYQKRLLRMKLNILIIFID